jgi:hypothetical protein
MVIVEKIAPALITECGGFLGRADDVGDENGGEDKVHLGLSTRSETPRSHRDFVRILTDVENVVDPRKLTKAGTGNMRCHVAPALDTPQSGESQELAPEPPDEYR